MSYEHWEYGFYTGLAGSYAYCLVNPARGLMMAAAVTAVVSKPSALTGAGEKWGTTSESIKTLGVDLQKHLDDVPVTDWTADDKVAFKHAVDKVVGNLSEGANAHSDAARFMNGLGHLSANAALLSGVAGVFLTALTIYTMATRPVPGLNVAAQASAEAAATTTQLTLSGMMRKYGVVITAASLVAAAVFAKQGELAGQLATLQGKTEEMKQLGLPLSNVQPVDTTGQSGAPTGQNLGVTGQNGGLTGQNGAVTV
ncbi:hypothetical protein [Sphaerisporangium dianthi]|uniref:ESX-1 secretion-associated protein EspA/EspE-like domain-containing protein n=1 Tax=Sphaerisporangium dianthi TaxID=1436120 RepID=A0ABV9C969_9ACTN